MFSFRRQNAQAKKRPAGNPERFEFSWKRRYNWFPALVILASIVFYVGQKDVWLPIKSIQISGSFEYIDEKEIEASLQSSVGEGFFSLDIQALRKILSDKPWTESVSIRRVWPSRINIAIVEKKPVARWDDHQLISDKAIIYAANTDDFQSLPMIHSVNANPANVLNQYYRLSQRFQSLSETVLSLRQDSRGALDIELANDLQIKVGRTDIDHKIDRLITIYEKEIQPRRLQIRLLDLRYANGFAVAWKKEILEDRDEASIWSNNNV